MTEQEATDKLPVFICYRQADGKAVAEWVFAALDGQTVETVDSATGEALTSKLDVYFDQTAPAVPSWEDVHEPFLKRSRAFVVICSPAAKLKEEGDDWVHKELNWWVNNRNAAPILVDPLAAERDYTPDLVKNRWPNAQRIRVVDEEWRQLSKAELPTEKRRLRDRLVQGIAGSREQYLKQELQQQEELNTKLRRSLVATISFFTLAALLAGYSFWQNAKLDTAIALLAVAYTNLNNANETLKTTINDLEVERTEKEVALESARDNEKLANDRANDLAAEIERSNQKSVELLIRSAEFSRQAGAREQASLALLEAFRLNKDRSKATQIRIGALKTLELPIENFDLPDNAIIVVGKSSVHVEGPDYVGNYLANEPGIKWHGKGPIDDSNMRPVREESQWDTDNGWRDSCLMTTTAGRKLRNEPGFYGMGPTGVRCESHQGFSVFRFSNWGSGGETQYLKVFNEADIPLPIEGMLKKAFGKSFSPEGDIVSWVGIHSSSSDSDPKPSVTTTSVVIIFRNEVEIFDVFFDPDKKRFVEPTLKTSFTLPFHPDDAVIASNKLLVANATERKLARVNLVSEPYTVGFKKLTSPSERDNTGDYCNPVAMNIEIVVSSECNQTERPTTEEMVVELRSGSQAVRILVEATEQPPLAGPLLLEHHLFIALGDRLLVIDTRKISWQQNQLDLRKQTAKLPDGVSVIGEPANELLPIGDSEFLVVYGGPNIVKYTVSAEGELSRKLVRAEKNPVIRLHKTKHDRQILYWTISSLSMIGFKLFHLDSGELIKDFGSSYKGNGGEASVDRIGRVIVRQPGSDDEYEFQIPGKAELEKQLLKAIPEYCMVGNNASWQSSPCWKG